METKMDYFDNVVDDGFAACLNAIKEKSHCLNATHYYSGFEDILQDMYKQGKLSADDEDVLNLMREAHSDYYDEYSINLGWLYAAEDALRHGASIKTIFSVSREALTAIAGLHKHADTDDIDTALKAADILFSEENLGLICYLSGKTYRSNDLDGYALLKFIDYYKKADREYTNAYELVNSVSWLSCNDSAEKVPESLAVLSKKYYTYDAISLLFAAYGTDCDYSILPKCHTLMGIMVKGECMQKEPLKLEELLYAYERLESLSKGYYSFASEESLATYQAIYDAGFSIAFLRKYDDIKQACEHLIKMVSMAIRIARQDKYRLRLNRRNTVIYHVKGKPYVVLKPEIMLELFRLILYKMDYLDVEQFNDSDYTAYSINRWLDSFNGKVYTGEGDVSIAYATSAEYEEIRIILNNAIVFDFPKDFFTEYQDALSSWLKSIDAKNCYVSSGTQGILTIIFSSSTQFSTINRDNPISVSVDLATKKKLIFGSGYRIDMPILKIMLCEQFKKYGKDPDVIETLDPQTVLALIQVLVLQDSEEYKVLFQRDDSFMSGFKLLRWLVRADDNFYSAAFRYICIAAGVISKYSSGRISPNMQNYVVLPDSKTLPILGIFGGDTSIIQYLKAHKDTKIALREDVIHFD